MRPVLIAVAITILGAGGCASNKKQEPPMPASSLLPLDPTESYELSKWWSDGEHLLHLDPSGTYRRYDGNDRYREPAERGRWWQQSYATLWLEPYARLGGRPARVAIRKDGERLALDVPGLRPMTPLPGPPEVIEDRLVGQWSGAGGDLRLGQDLRYWFSPRSAKPGAPAALAGQQGAWTVQEDMLLLQPDSSGLPATLLRIRRQDDTIVLEAPQGALERRPLLPQSG
jgi:hypothetical protein